MRATVAIAMILAVLLAGEALAQSRDGGATRVGYPASYFADLKANNARDMVGRIPGFTYDEGKTGDNARPSNVLLNGKRVAEDGRPTSDLLRSIQAKAVRHIELIRAPGKPAIANVVARPPDAFRGTVNITGQHLQNDRGGGGLGLNMQSRSPARTIDMALNASRSPSGGSLVFRNRFSAASGDLQSSTQQETGGFADRLDLRLGYDTKLKGGRLRVNGSTAYTANDNNDRSVNGLSGTVSRSASTSASNTDSLEARYNRDIGEKGDISLRLAHSDNAFHSSAFSGSRVFTSRSHRQSWQSSVQYQHEPAQTRRYRAGFDTDFDAQGGRSLTLLDGRPVGPLSTNADAERLRLVPFAGANFEASPKLRVDTVLRHETIVLQTFGRTKGDRTFDIVRPSLILNLTPDKLTDASLQIERTVEPIDLGAFIAFVERNTSDDEDEIIAGNPGLVPQTTWVVRARYQRRFDKGSITFTASHAEVENIYERVLLTTITPDPSRPGETITRFSEAAGNIGDGFREDFGVILDLPLQGVGLKDGMLRLSTNWRESELTDAFTGEDHRFSGETPFSWSANLSAGFLNGQLRTGADVSNSAPSVSYSRSELTTSTREPYVTTYLEYRPQPELTARFEVRDVTRRSISSVREIFSCTGCPSARAAGALSAREERVSLAGPSFHMNLRRTF